MPIEQAVVMLSTHLYHTYDEKLARSRALSWLHQVEAYPGMVDLSYNKMGSILQDYPSGWSTVSAIAVATLAYYPKNAGAWLSKIVQLLETEPFQIDLHSGLTLAIFEGGVCVDQVWRNTEARDAYDKWWKLLLKIFELPVWEQYPVNEQGELLYPDNSHPAGTKVYPGRLCEAIKTFTLPDKKNYLSSTNTAIYHRLAQVGALACEFDLFDQSREFPPFVEMLIEQLSYARFRALAPRAKMRLVSQGFRQ